MSRLAQGEGVVPWMTLTKSAINAWRSSDKVEVDAVDARSIGDDGPKPRTGRELIAGAGVFFTTPPLPEGDYENFNGSV